MRRSNKPHTRYREWKGLHKRGSGGVPPMEMADFIANLTEEQLLGWLDRYRSFGPLPGIALAFLKSFVPPLPTLLIVGVNAVVYGLWLGFLYSWIGMVGGCLLTFWLVRKVAGHPYLARWAGKPKVRKAIRWARRNAFGYVFLLSLFPVGPFVVINIAAGLAGIRFRSFAPAVAAGKAIMIFAVSYIGYDVSRYIDNPLRLIYVVLFIALSWWVGRKVEARFAKQSAPDASDSESAEER